MLGTWLNSLILRMCKQTTTNYNHFTVCIFGCDSDTLTFATYFVSMFTGKNERLIECLHFHIFITLKETLPVVPKYIQFVLTFNLSLL